MGEHHGAPRGSRGRNPLNPNRSSWRGQFGLASGLPARTGTPSVGGREGIGGIRRPRWLGGRRRADPKLLGRLGAPRLSLGRARPTHQAKAKRRPGVETKAPLGHVPPAMHRRALILIAVATLAAWQFPAGRFVVYPFTLLATYAHEMGHGLTAWLLGGRFVELVLFADGSGTARHATSGARWVTALVAAGGLVGPSLAGGALLAASRVPGAARLWLLLLGLAMWVSVFAVVRNGTGVVFVTLFGAALLAVVRFRPRWSPWVLQLVAVQLGLSVFQDLDYMFSPGGRVGGAYMRSDSAAIQQALWLPYWFWGGIAALVAFGAVGFGAWIAFRPSRNRPPPVC